MSMSKRDYDAIASILKDARGDEKDEPLIRGIEEDLAIYLEEDNPRFDADRFLAACRGEDAKDSAGRTVKYGR